MSQTSPLPVPPPPPAQPPEDLWIAFTVIDLKGSASSVDRMVKDGTQDQKNRWGGVKSIMSTLNTVVGDRQELMITVTINEADSPPRVFTSPSPGSPLLSQTLYQSEQVAWELVQQSPPTSSEATTRVVSSQGCREETVHFCVPARVSSTLTGKTLIAGLWQCLPRSAVRRSLLGWTTVSWDELQGLQATSPGQQYAVCSRAFQSERFPSSRLLIWRLPPQPSMPLSLAPLGVANHRKGLFNPMIAYFSLLQEGDPSYFVGGGDVESTKEGCLHTSVFKETLEPSGTIDLGTGGEDEVQGGGAVGGRIEGLEGGIARGNARGDLLLGFKDVDLGDDGKSAATTGQGAAVDLGLGSGSGPVVKIEDSMLPGGKKLLACQEMAVETDFALKLPLQFLFPVHNGLRRSAAAWRMRQQLEQARQGYFATEQEAFAEGMLLGKVSVIAARGLGGLASMALAASPKTEQFDQHTANAQGWPGSGVGMGSRGANTGADSLGGGGGEEGDRASGNGKIASMKRLSGGMRRLGGKAVTMAKNASQASPVAHMQLRLGGAASQSRALRQANFYVKIAYQSAVGLGVGTSSAAASGPGPGLDSGPDFFGTDSGGSKGASPVLVPARLLGCTNTEYGGIEPVWNSNANKNACPHNQPRLHHQVAGSCRLEKTVLMDNHELEMLGSRSVAVSGEGRPKEGLEEGSVLSFCFYFSQKDVANGELHLYLYQNMYSLSSGISDYPVGCLILPLAQALREGGQEEGIGPRWFQLEGIPEEAQGGGGEGEQQPELLVRLAIQDLPNMSASPPPSQEIPEGTGRPVSEPNNVKSGAGGGGGVLGRLRSDGDGSFGLRSVLPNNFFMSKDEERGEVVQWEASARGSAGEEGKVQGSFIKEADESDSDDEALLSSSVIGDAADVGDVKYVSPGAGASSSVMNPIKGSDFKYSTHLEGGPKGWDPIPGEGKVLSTMDLQAVKDVTVQSCYDWIESIGGGAGMNSVDMNYMATLIKEVEYPLEWMNRHTEVVCLHMEKVAKVVDMYCGKMKTAEGLNFRSSMLKKDPLLQFVATNLHLQVLSVRDPLSGKDTHYDFTSTGAPAAHMGGYTGGGLVSKENALALSKERLLACHERYKRATAESVHTGERHNEVHTKKVLLKLSKLQEVEEYKCSLRKALLEYELLFVEVAMRRVCVGSQAVSIAAASFCVKLEMMARGTLNLEAGGCSTAEGMASRWIKHGFLIGFEGLLSIQGKEHGMVEDTVIALDMVSKYTLQVVPATPDNPPITTQDQLPHDVGSNCGDGRFELEVGIVGHVIQFRLGRSSLVKLPRVLWNSSDTTEGSSFGSVINHGVGSGDVGGCKILICPVLFTQGIDIQQSMSNASGPSNKKASFQADINVKNLEKLNDYCHKVFPPDAGGNQGSGPPTADAMGDDAVSGEASQDLLGQRLACSVPDKEVDDVGQKLRSMSGVSAPAQRMHPMLCELESAVCHDKVNHKNMAILMEAQLAVRRLGGGRVTFCKSGKDRTAMSVTLEEALLLIGNHVQPNVSSPNQQCLGGDSTPSTSHSVLPPSQTGPDPVTWREAETNGALKVANVLRAHGVRLMIAEKNVGRPKYSFNALQRQFIPDLYQPPLQTIQDVITSALNRDS